MRRAFLLIFATLFFSGCMKFGSVFKSRTFEVNEGYLSIMQINKNIQKQLPKVKKVGNNKVEIRTIYIFSSKDGKNLVAELEFIFYSFEIPEGLPAVARVQADLVYDTKEQEFRLGNIRDIEIKYLKESLLEYLSPNQEKFIKETIIEKLYEIILHKSKRRLKPLKSFEAKEGKIKVVFE